MAQEARIPQIGELGSSWTIGGLPNLTASGRKDYLPAASKMDIPNVINLFGAGPSHGAKEVAVISAPMVSTGIAQTVTALFDVPALGSWNAVGSPSSVVVTYPDGMLLDIPNEQYHADKTSHSCTGIKEFIRSPAHYQAYLQNKSSRTHAKDIGTMFHMVLLEPSRFDKDVIVWTGNKKSVAWKKFKDDHKGEVILSQEEYDGILGMRDAVLNFIDYPIAQALHVSEKEKSLFWTDEETGLRFRIRPDAINPYLMIDLKKCQDARPRAFRWDCRSYGYDVQAAMYTIGAKEGLGLDLPFYFLAVEENAPHGVWLHKASQSMIEEGSRKFNQAKRELKDCLDCGVWPGYTDAISDIVW